MTQNELKEKTGKSAQEIIKLMKEAIDSGNIKMEVKDMYRTYTNGIKEIIIGEPNDTLYDFYNTFISPKELVDSGFFDALPRCTIYVGPPDTGKTYKAVKECEHNNIPYILIMGREDLTLESLLQDFTLIDGKPSYTNSLALDYLSGTNKCVIIIDEFNTLRTGVLKTFQPLFDTTSDTFEFKSKVYKKNMDCKFICTLNDKDKGISILPDAILSRSKFIYFDKQNTDTLVKWTGYDKNFILNVEALYNFLDLLPIYGTRQLEIIHSCLTMDDIVNHFKGLLSMRNKDIKIISTPEFQTKVNKILIYITNNATVNNDGTTISK